MNLKINKKQAKKRAFSLAEALLSLLIVSILLVLTAPVLLKANNRPENTYNGGSQGFYYKQSDADDGKCYLTALDRDGKTTVQNTGECQQFDFTIPDGVYRIDLTLVAGGGGGGGAAGGTVYERKYMSTEDGVTKLEKVPQDRIKSIIVNLLTGKGENGRNITTDAANKVIYSGQGGRSGMAVINQELPEDFYKIGYTNPSFLNLDTETINLRYNQNNTNANVGLKTLHDIDPNISSFDGIGFYARKTKSGTVYGSNIFVSDSTGTLDDIQCFNLTTNTSNKKLSSSIAKLSNSNWDELNNLCGLTKSSYKSPVSGTTNSLKNNTAFSNGYTIPGGEGGRVPGYDGIYGKGGNGQPATLSCYSTDGCKSNQVFNGSTVYTTTNGASLYYNWAVLDITKPVSSGGESYGDVTVQLVGPGGVGSGGAGGSAIKINDYPVVPGEKFTIVVGKGGSGGESGRSGLIQLNEYASQPQDGLNGEGGSSTALYDSNGNLLVMVIGGIGGNGGSINEEAMDMAVAGGLGMSDYSSYIPLPPATESTRSVPLVIYNTDKLNNSSYLDTSVVTSLETDNTSLGSITPTGNRKIPRYAYLSNNASPLFVLNSGKAEVAKTASVYVTDENTRTTGGFSEYSRVVNDVQNKSGKYGSDTINNFYNGFYFRNIVNGSISYPGGLGGHSGLGSKAGCGGLFVGNQNVILGSINTNAFLVRTDSSNNRIYNVASYYGNCSISDSDGHTAEFVAPTSTPALGQTLGQAGSGGGGGGWSHAYGAGKGGNGQDGYVFINWRTR